MRPSKRWFPFLAAILLVIGVAPRAGAHCDTADGPVAADVTRALAAGDVTPVLKWVTAEDEGEVRRVFAQASEVRQAGGTAAELADRHFLETAVRLHRLSEGEPYTGVKPAGTPVSPAVTAVDAALRSGSADSLIHELQRRVAERVSARFDAAHQAAAHASHHVEAGREAVHAYVELAHFVEHLHGLLDHAAASASGAGGAAHDHAAERH